MMEVLAPGSVHARPSARPHNNVSGNFPAHMCAESPSNISTNPSEVISKVFEPKDNFCPPKYSIVWGLGGFHQIIFGGNPHIFVT